MIKEKKPTQRTNILHPLMNRTSNGHEYIEGDFPSMSFDDADTEKRHLDIYPHKHTKRKREGSNKERKRERRRR